MKRKTYRSLADYLARSGERQEDFAARIGKRQGYVSRVARGLILPRPEMRKVMATAARCPVDSFIRVNRDRRQAESAHLDPHQVSAV